MKSSPERIRKPKLDRTRLKNEGVIFFEDVCGDEDLEDWIHPIRDQVTRLRTTLPSSSRKQFEKEFKEFVSSGRDRGKAIANGWSLKPVTSGTEPVYFASEKFQEDPHLQGNKTELETCGRAAKEATVNRKRHESESRWTFFLQNYIFRSFDHVHQNPDSHKRTFLRWELHENLHWNEFSNAAARELTGPKPDLTFAFPIIDTTKKENFQYLKDLEVDSFSLPVLSKLRSEKHGNLKSAPTTKLHTWGKEKYSAMNAADMICFPWAIVEVKKIGDVNSDADSAKSHTSIMRDNAAREQFCYCQAANASYSALVMREELAAKAKDQHPSHDGLIIFAFTCVGPSAKLWVTYRKKPCGSSNEKEPITMRCIWATSLELTWGVMYLRMVVDNVREWVYQRAKPEISRWVRTAHNQPSERTFLTPDGETVVRKRRASSCGSWREIPGVELLGKKEKTPNSKAMPAMLRQRTSPKSPDLRERAYGVPKIQLNEMQQDSYDTPEEVEDDSDESASDEGYGSEHTFGSLSGDKDEDDGDEEYEDEDEDNEDEDEEKDEDEDEDSDSDSDEDDEDEDENEDEGEGYLIDISSMDSFKFDFAVPIPKPRAKRV